jgi:hypothetical protein
MRNSLNIDDVVNVIVPGLKPNGVIVKIDSMQKWSDGVIHYGGKHKDLGTDGKTMYDRGVQFTEEQCSLVDPKISIKEKVKNKQTEKSTENQVDKQTENPIELSKEI